MTLAGVLYVGWRVWPRKLAILPETPLPRIEFAGDRPIVRPPYGHLLGQVARFTDELSAYLHFEYLRGVRSLNGSRFLLACFEGQSGPIYRIFVVLPPDLLEGVQQLADLRARGYISTFSLAFLTPGQLRDVGQQTSLFVSAYNVPVQRRLEELSETRVLPSMARYILFKSVTDRRVREKISPIPTPLSLAQAKRLAADIIAVAHFYALPLDLLLGIGAIENNYMAVIGDWEHGKWKTRAEPGDIVLKRSRGRVYVWNYSRGVWQITRETLRKAHELYRSDFRDYSALPERLRPPLLLDLDWVEDDVLTTYAGLWLRSLLDHFEGDVERAAAAYNGGVRSPNLVYAAHVARIAEHARRVLDHAATLDNRNTAPGQRRTLISAAGQHGSGTLGPVFASTKPPVAP